MEAHEPQGTRYASLLWVESMATGGNRGFRIVYKLSHDHTTPPRSSVIRSDQIYRLPRAGDVVRIQFCVSRVLRVDRV